jgi:hypothetical protein
MIFERKITRKIFGPTRTDDGYWRIKTNQEINDLLKGHNIFTRRKFLVKTPEIWVFKLAVIPFAKAFTSVHCRSLWLIMAL